MYTLKWWFKVRLIIFSWCRSFHPHVIILNLSKDFRYILKLLEVENIKHILPTMQGHGQLSTTFFESCKNDYLQIISSIYCLKFTRDTALSISDCLILYTWLFLCWFYFREFRESDLAKFPLQFMSIYSNGNIRKIAKLSPCEFLHLVQNRKNICTRKLWPIQYIWRSF